MSGKNIDVIIGLQWGDEGKGKIVDYLADYIILFCKIIHYFTFGFISPLQANDYIDVFTGHITR